MVGFAFQSLKLTLGLFGLGVVGCLAVSAPNFDRSNLLTRGLTTCRFHVTQVTLPPLPAYTAHPVKWLPTLDQYGEPLSPSLGAAEETRKDR